MNKQITIYIYIIIIYIHTHIHTHILYTYYIYIYIYIYTYIEPPAAVRARGPVVQLGLAILALMPITYYIFLHFPIYDISDILLHFRYFIHFRYFPSNLG